MYPVNYYFNSPQRIEPTTSPMTDDEPIHGIVYEVSKNGSGFFRPTHQTHITIFIPPQHLGGAKKGDRVQIVKEGTNLRGAMGKVISIDTVPLTPLIKGTIDVIHNNGSAYCRSTIDQSFIFIHQQHTESASQDDTVLVQILRHWEYPRYPEGKIIQIVQRARTDLACIVHTSQNDRTEAYCPLLKRTISLQSSEAVPHPEKGMRIHCTVDQWGQAPDAIQATAISSLGTMDNSTSDLSFIIAEYKLPKAFPQEVLTMDEEAISTFTDIRSRMNHTALACCSIDSPFTTTFDDAISLGQTIQGDYLLGVHVADASHYVPLHSVIDHEARHRSQTIYLPGHTIPMLPDTITNTLCSLTANTQRLAVSVFARFTAEGECVQTDIQRSLIENKYNFSYDQARAILCGTEQHPYATTLSIMCQLAQLLRQKRNAPIVHEQRTYHIAHAIVEEFMLQANQIVAAHLTATQTTALFRTTFAHANSSKTIPAYTTEQLGHAGFACSPYCHFTSPLRRYTDLTIHRLLFDAEALEEEDLNQLALHANEQEHNSKKAERAMRWMQTLRRAERLYQHSSHPAAHPLLYTASVTKVSSNMVIFEVTLEDFLGTFCLEGALPTALVPLQTQRPGERLLVSFQGVDWIHQQAIWHHTQTPQESFRHR